LNPESPDSAIALPQEHSTAFATSFFATLPGNPMIGRYPDQNIFNHAVARTPFVVFYRVDGAAIGIAVVAIFHGSQDRRKFEVTD
jgi:plasmid stabilization system protein ParE